MLKRIIVMGVILALALAAHPAGAAKKKRAKKPKPYKSQEVTLAAPHPIFYGATGSVNTIVAKELEATCETPKSNGTDAFAFEVPAAYQKIIADVEAIGSSAGAASYDLDIYLYDKACKNTLALNAEGTDEAGSIPKGTAWILVHNYLGDPATKAYITLKAR